MNRCPVCNGKEGKIIALTEMMFGTKEFYDYKECNECKTLYLLNEDIPSNEIYPKEYHSFREMEKENAFKHYIKKYIYKYYLRIKANYGSDWIKNCIEKGYDAKILDVGCGVGYNLKLLNDYGFNNLYGIDPFLSGPNNNSQLKIYKTNLENFSEKNFDVIMFHHVFEHLDNPRHILKLIKGIIKSDAIIIIRIPVKDSHAWELYRENWVQLDPPRHAVTYTKNSFEKLCLQEGFKVIKQFCDSYEFQFLGSEQAKKNIPLFSPLSYTHDKNKFSKNEIKKYIKESKSLNKNNYGDQSVFILKFLI